MAFKVIFAALFLTSAIAAYQHHGHTDHDFKVEYKEDYHDIHPKYKFEYKVHSPHTGDIKSQKEERDGDIVHGHYELQEPDGSKRIVHYNADHHHGFQAVVHRQHNVHPQHYHHHEEHSSHHEPFHHIEPAESYQSIEQEFHHEEHVPVHHGHLSTHYH